MHRCVVSTFADTFRALESEEKLDPLNEVDLFCLHYVFLPRINRCLSEFQDSWNHHGLSSEANKSPLQLFLEGLMHISNDRIPGDSESMDANVSNLAGDCVLVPRIHFLPCSNLLQALQVIDPLQLCSNNGY